MLQGVEEAWAAIARLDCFLILADEHHHVLHHASIDFAAGRAADAAVVRPPASTSQPGDSRVAQARVSAGVPSSLPAGASPLRQSVDQQAILEAGTDSAVEQMVQSWHTRSPSPPKKKRGRPPTSPTGPPPTAMVVSPARNWQADCQRSQEFLCHAIGSSKCLMPADVHLATGRLPETGASLEGSSPC